MAPFLSPEQQHQLGLQISVPSLELIQQSAQDRGLFYDPLTQLITPLVKPKASKKSPATNGDSLPSQTIRR